MSKTIAEQLLRAHRDDVAQAILQGVDRLAPGLAQVEVRARFASILSIVDGIADAMKSGDTEPLASLLRGFTRLRTAGGVSQQDLLASSHGYLPGVRKVFLRTADPRAALAAYEAVEDLALPVIAEYCRVVLNIDAAVHDDDITNPGRQVPTKKGARRGVPSSPFDSAISTDGEGAKS
jgi:hypothetical protein